MISTGWSLLRLYSATWTFQWPGLPGSGRQVRPGS